MTINFEINILQGLPGSGKTYFAKHEIERQENEDNNEYYLIELDDYMNNTSDISEALIQAFEYRHIIEPIFGYDKIIYIDGLILSFDTLSKVIQTCKKYLDYKNNHIDFNIHHWLEDRDTCLFNDKHRVISGERDKTSAHTIKHAEYHIVNAWCSLDKEDKCNYEVIHHKVYNMNSYEGLLKQYEHCLYPDKMRSDHWSLGGTCGSCWSDQLDTIQPDKQLSSFVNFDELLEKVCPNITFLQYKNIYNNCVSIHEWRESDYYGGVEYFACYECDLKKLYELLKEKEII